MTPLTDQQLEAIKTREQAARPGPWRLENANEGESQVYGPRWVIATAEDIQDDWSVSIDVGDEETGRFITEARQDVPALLAEVERLTADAATLHVPAVARMRSGEWGVYCYACSAKAGDYVTACQVRDDLEWPPTRVLRDGPPSALIDAKQSPVTAVPEATRPAHRQGGEG